MSFYQISRRNNQTPRALWKTWDSIAHDFDSFFQDFDKALGNPSVSESVKGNEMRRESFSPLADVEENEKSYELSLDMPGFKLDNLNLEINGRTLSVSGKREYKSSDSKLHRSEKFYGEYRRSITLPENVKGEDIQAQYEDGVLSISLPKAQVATSRKIEIGTNQSALKSEVSQTSSLRMAQDKTDQISATH